MSRARSIGPNVAATCRPAEHATELGNKLLLHLPTPVLAHLAPRLERVPLRQGTALLDVGDALRHAYFPLTGLVALLGTEPDGRTVELTAVGSDGFIGLPLVLGQAVAAHGARVLVPGAAWRIAARALDDECRQHEKLRQALLEWSHAVLLDISQAVVCHRFHRVLERLCAYLLRASDRLETDSLPLTHDALAQGLGVTRQTVSVVATAIADAGAIQYRRGCIRIRDRRRLERSACECYRTAHTSPPVPECGDLTR